MAVSQWTRNVTGHLQYDDGHRGLRTSLTRVAVPHSRDDIFHPAVHVTGGLLTHIRHSLRGGDGAFTHVCAIAIIEEERVAARRACLLSVYCVFDNYHAGLCTGRDLSHHHYHLTAIIYLLAVLVLGDATVRYDCIVLARNMDGVVMVMRPSLMGSILTRLWLLFAH